VNFYHSCHYIILQQMMCSECSNTASYILVFEMATGARSRVSKISSDTQTKKSNIASTIKNTNKRYFAKGSLISSATTKLILFLSAKMNEIQSAGKSMNSALHVLKYAKSIIEQWKINHVALVVMELCWFEESVSQCFSRKICSGHFGLIWKLFWA